MEYSSARRRLERRRYPRLSATSENTLIMLPEEKISGALIDISMGGLSFHYSGNPFQLGSMLQQGILVGEDDLWLEDFPIKTVHDFVDRIPLAKGEPYVRRRCLQFCDLTDRQQKLLTHFIWLNTEMEAAFRYPLRLPWQE